MGNAKASKTAQTRADHDEQLPKKNVSAPKQNPYEQAYESLIANEQVNRDLMNTFQELRILVVGRTGSGKTTLIRLMMGDTGPRNIVHGSAARQDIKTEWRHPHLPLIIHDSNGIDTSGADRKSEIQRFLRNCQSNNSTSVFSKRVHAVWYVFSGIDNRVKDDGGLLRMLDEHGDRLPLLLVMTHNDMAMKLGDGKEEKCLEKLLEFIPDDARRARLKGSTVRVANDIEIDEATGEIVEWTFVDEEALRRVSEETMELLSETLRSTWVACQAVDMKAKVEESVKLILKRRNYQAMLSVPGTVLPIVHQLEMMAMLWSVTKGLLKIWNAPKNLETVISSLKKLEDEWWTAATGNLGTNILAAVVLIGVPLIISAAGPTATTTGAEVGEAAILAGASTAEAATAVATVPAASTSASASGVKASFISGFGLGAVSKAALHSVITQSGYGAKIVVSYGFLVLGTLMYASTHDVNHRGSVEYYERVCQDFYSSGWCESISRLSDGHQSLWKSFFSRETQSECLQSEISTFFSQLCKQIGRADILPGARRSAASMKR